jgi:LmbE family N-acetylglucosaminyl deacetylase
LVTQPILLTVMAHPDDAELWAGGTIARHVHTGGVAGIAVATHDPVRAREAAVGAHILSAHLYPLDDLTIESIGRLLTDVRPDVVITHPINDIHPEHRRCAEIVLVALPEVVIATGHPRRVYCCDGYNNLDQHGIPLNLPTAVDITKYWPTKMGALEARKSQPVVDHFGPMAEVLSRLHGCGSAQFAPKPFTFCPSWAACPHATSFDSSPFTAFRPASSDMAVVSLSLQVAAKGHLSENWHHRPGHRRQRHEPVAWQACRYRGVRRRCTPRLPERRVGDVRLCRGVRSSAQRRGYGRLRHLRRV